MSKSNKNASGWLDRHLADPANRLAFEEEYVVISTSEELLRTVDRSAVSRSKLAELLGTSRANVTQLLNGRRNLTLRTLARIAFFMGYRIRVLFQRLDRQRLEEVPLPAVRVVNLLVSKERFAVCENSVSQTDAHFIEQLAV